MKDRLCESGLQRYDEYMNAESTCRKNIFAAMAMALALAAAGGGGGDDDDESRQVRLAVNPWLAPGHASTCRIVLVRRLVGRRRGAAARRAKNADLERRSRALR